MTKPVPEITANRVRGNRYNIAPAWTSTPLRPVVTLHPSEPADPREGRPAPEERYAHADIALPDPDGYAYPLVLRVSDPYAACALADLLSQVAAALAEPYDPAVI